MSKMNEIFLVFVLAELAIWSSTVTPILSWIFGIIAVIFVLRYWRNNFAEWKTIFRPRGNNIHYGQMCIAFFACGTAILTIGAVYNPQVFNRPDLAERFAISVLFYLGNALWQQILVVGYFLPRLEQKFRSERKAVIALGILFALVHIPNPVLVPVTFIGGMLCAYFFQKTRNIYALIVAHAILAVAIMHLLPGAWHHHLRIGPGFFR